MNKNGQVWSLDLLVAFMIFLITLICVYFYTINYVANSSSELNQLFLNADIVANLLLSEDNYGLISDGRINKTRVEEFSSLSDSQKKATLGATNNFYFVISGYQDIVGIVNVTDVDSQVKITRIVIYEDKPTKFEIISWR